MRFQGKYILAGALLAWVGFGLAGCSKEEAEAPPVPVAEPAPAPEAPPPVQSAAPVQVQMQTAQQVNANWDSVSKQIAAQNYDNAVRNWIAMDQARRQAQMNEALQAEYYRRAYLAQEALRQKAETDAKAREAYQALGRVMMGR